jgi:hypothetical protein
MIEIKVVTDFSFAPGARDYDDGKDSGQEFYETLLKIKFKEALDKNLKLKIDLDGVEGYPSSFLSESFGLLGNEFGADEVWNRLILISNEVPKYIKKIKNYIYEER